MWTNLQAEAVHTILQALGSCVMALLVYWFTSSIIEAHAWVSCIDKKCQNDTHVFFSKVQRTFRNTVIEQVSAKRGSTVVAT